MPRDPCHGHPSNAHPGDEHPGNGHPGNEHPGNGNPGNVLGEAGRQTNCRDILFAFFQNRTTQSKKLITPEKDKHKLMTG